MCVPAQVHAVRSSLHCGKHFLCNMRQRRLKSKTSPDESTTRRMTPEQIRARTFERAAKLLAAKARSVAELRERLLERCSNKAVVETVIARLREYGYLDDERYALSYASSKVRQSPAGR